MPSASFFRVLIEPKTNSTEVWIARCLETGYVASGNGRDEARDQMLEILREEVSYSLRNNNLKPLFQQVPQELQSRWEAAIRDNPPQTIPLFPDDTNTQKIKLATLPRAA